jgi:tartrate-resistant acid phosphatase type 5
LYVVLCAAAPATVTLAPRDGVLRVAVAGDAGDGTAAVARGIAKVHAARPLDAIVLPGDNIYPCGVRSVTDPRWAILRPLSAIGIPILPVLGNHDVCGDAGAQIAATGVFPQWRFPAREYVVHGGVADFAMLDTNPLSRGAAPPDVASLFAGSAARWRIAVGHHTVVSSGWHGYFPRAEHRNMRRLLTPLREAKVDLYVCGHDHHLELIDGKPRFLVSGAASDPIVPVALHPRTLWPDALRRQGGFAVLELRAESISVTFFTVEGRRIGGPFRFRR